MTATSPSAFMLSATLHGVVIALALLLAYATGPSERDEAKILELVAGEGDNYMATEAPALGTPGGVKLATPKAPEPTPAPPPPEPVKVEPTPAPPPTPKAVTTPTPPVEQPAPNFKKKIQRDLIVAESKAKREIAKERAAEKKRQEEEAKKLTKEEFDRLNKGKASPQPSAKSGPTKVAKIDAEGIAKGVVGGSTKNKVGGAGGKALTNDNANVLAAYDKMFKDRLRREFEAPPGLSDSLKVDIEVRSNADGTLGSPRVKKSSGSAEFDRAVLEALRRVRMPARPDKRSETLEFTFTMKEKDE